MNLRYRPRAYRPRPVGDGGDRYLRVLGVALLGYALFSRSFAYLGVPPLFIGEVLLALGVVTLARVRSLRWMGEQPALWLLAALSVLVVARTLPYLGRYGLDAPRDAMLLGYGAFAFVVAGLLVARPDRLPAMLRRYRAFAAVMVACAWIVYLCVKLVGEGVPRIPWADGTRVLEAKAGDLLVHLCAITVFVVFGFARRRPWLVALLALSVGLTVVSTRGGTAAYGLGVAAAWLLRPPTARVGRLAYAFAALLAVSAVVGPMIAVNGGEREVSAEQLWRNVTSVFEASGTSALDGSRRWRMLWWGAIWDYTVEGPYFWTGKGFGINLAEADGYGVAAEPVLRSPHNGHLTLLARAGVPGLALWVALHLAWFAAVLRAWAAARGRRQPAWMGLFALLVAYAVAAHVNGAFDVYFEGPMGGIWFWTVWGVGLAAAVLHPRHPHLLDGLLATREGASPPAQLRAWAWPARPAGARRPAAVSRPLAEAE
jgi:hypothetical protein